MRETQPKSENKSHVTLENPENNVALQYHESSAPKGG